MGEWYPWRVVGDSCVRRWDCRDCPSGDATPVDIDTAAETHTATTGHTVQIMRLRTRILGPADVK